MAEAETAMAPEAIAIKGHLLKGEKILASVTTQEARFHATNKRVIRHAKRFGGERVDFLSHPHIASVTLESKSYLPEGIAAIIAGVLIPYILSQFLQPPRDLMNAFWILGLVLIILGVLLCFYKTSWYQLRATGLSAGDLQLWKITTAKAPEVKKFVHVIEEQITKKE